MKIAQVRQYIIALLLVAMPSILHAQEVDGIEKLNSISTPEKITSLAFLPRSSMLVYLDESGKITIHNLVNDEKDSWPAGFAASKLQISKNGKYLAVGGNKGIAIFEVATHKQVMYHDDFGEPGILRFDPKTSNILIYTVDPKKLMYHNIENGDRMQIKTVHPLFYFNYQDSGEFLVVGTKISTYSVNLNTGNTKVFYKQNQQGESNVERLGLWDDHCRPLAFIDSGKYFYTRPFGNFKRYITIFDTATGELEDNIYVDYNVALEQNLDPLGISEEKNLVLIPLSISEKPVQPGAKMALFNLKTLKRENLVATYSFKKKAKGKAKLFSDLSDNGKFIAIYCPSCEKPTLDIFRVKY